MGLLGFLALLLSAGTAGAARSSHSSQLSGAKRSLLVLADMPKGWSASRSSNNNTNTPYPDAAQFATCIGVPTSIIYNAPSVSSPEFDSKDQLLSVGDSVQVYSSNQAAQADFSSLANPKTPSCMTTDLNGPGKSQFAAQIGGSGIAIGNVTVTRTPQSDYAPHAANVTIYFPITTKGVTVNVELTLVDYVKGREEQSVAFTAFQSVFPAALARHLTTVADSRI